MLKLSKNVYWKMPWGVLSIEGRDAKDYLQRMSTANLKLLSDGQLTHAAFLTGKGTTVGLGVLKRAAEDKYLFLLPLTHVAELRDHLEKFHFAEALTVADKSNDCVLFGVLGEEPAENDVVPAMKASSNGPVSYWTDDRVGELAWALIPAGSQKSFEQSLANQGFTPNDRAWDAIRVEYTIPESGKELSAKEIILEGNFDRAVARNKGCYPGQEVVERIFTYGSVNKKLMPVKVERAAAGWPNELPVEFETDGKWAGALVTLAPHEETDQMVAGLAYLHKAHWDRKDPFELPNGIKVSLRGNE